MGLIMSGVILGAIYLLKIFMPQFVINVAHIDSIVNIGHYIDTHKWAWYLATTIISFASYYLICCACCKKKSLSVKEMIYIVVTILALFIIKEFLPAQYTSINIISMILLPFLMKADFNATVVVFVSTTILQSFTVEIRNIVGMVSDYNFATLTILMIDYYILETLLYFMFNYKRKED